MTKTTASTMDLNPVFPGKIVGCVCHPHVRTGVFLLHYLLWFQRISLRRVAIKKWIIRP